MKRDEVVRDRQTALELLSGAVAAEHRQRSCQEPRPPKSVKTPPPPGTHRSARSTGRRRLCRCGICKACRENARWERIYNEKFADLGYYNGLRLSNRSPLASF
jgi:hypothetical protein